VQRSRYSRRLRRRVAALALAAFTVLAALVVPAMAQAKPATVKVMTRNIYLGAKLTDAMLAETPAELYAAAGQIWEDMHDTNFRARATRIAQEVATHKPDAIGLQEVALWRRGAPGDLTPTSTADEVVQDYLEILQSQLRERGLNYRVAVKQKEADITLPLDRNGDGFPEFLGRLTMHDAILVKRNKRLRIKNARGGNYGPALPVPTALGSTILVTRGWTAVDVTKVQGKKKRGKRGKKKVQKKTFRFINTHLEAFSSFFRNAQAFELVSNDRLMATKLPTILVGDLNSDPVDDEETTIPGSELPPTAENAAYNTIAAAGFADRGLTENTCCHADDLRNQAVSFGSRIDHVLSKGRVQRVRAVRTGDNPDLRTPTGLWPSDHAGVVSTLRVR